jgi:NAD(P)-dependent dehydrogenase (short-subunit alcohol dehydrogenase family)
VSHYGRLDVLVNNAAIDHTNNLLDVTAEDIDDHLRSQHICPYEPPHCGRSGHEGQGEGGSIINITSRLASIGVPTMGVYSASKGAMLAFTTASAIDLAPFNIRVNAVAPGMTRTPSTTSGSQASITPSRKPPQ